MVKLSSDLIEQCAQYINAVRDRELDLRGYKIPVIENLGATLDQFDTIDFSDNEIRKLDGFPLLKRLKCLLLNNNRIWALDVGVEVEFKPRDEHLESEEINRIGDNLEQNLPKLESIILTNNLIQELGDIDPLASISTLTSLSLLRNPVVSKKHYRQYVIHKIPQIKLLDFRKVRQKEREASAQLFKGKKGQQLAKDLGKKSRTFVPGAEIPGEKPTTSGPTAEDIAAIKKAITEAKSLEEVERLNQILRSGKIPGKESDEKGAADAKEEMEEEQEEADVEEMDSETAPSAINGTMNGVES